MIPAPVRKAAPAATDAQAAPANIDPVTAYDRQVRAMIADGRKVLAACPDAIPFAARFAMRGDRLAYAALIGLVGHEAANHAVVFASGQREMRERQGR